MVVVSILDFFNLKIMPLFLSFATSEYQQLPFQKNKRLCVYIFTVKWLWYQSSTHKKCGITKM